MSKAKDDSVIQMSLFDRQTKEIDADYEKIIAYCSVYCHSMSEAVVKKTLADNIARALVSGGLMEMKEKGNLTTQYTMTVYAKRKGGE